MGDREDGVVVNAAGGCILKVGLFDSTIFVMI